MYPKETQATFILIKMYTFEFNIILSDWKTIYLQEKGHE